MAVSPSDEPRTSSAKFLGIETGLQENQSSEREVQKIYHSCHTTSVKAGSLDFSFVTPPI
ncbi:hypothetical protein IscW_ISCW010406 [Ixodes scapularis]|uniref:Uncharacterized protein n=1 Tax=Ixodes scapularis TaxID=6945 RepID=B7Q5Q6_IXOSC|nr:hypothetical protein IscW_ISCW010406 [Ixodes scapularis]|eukprot:XP_002402193.1 hypothetical protein IscW_ISCW010406 [Ixodes scapularis]